MPPGSSPLTFGFPANCAVLSSPAAPAFRTKPPGLVDGSSRFFAGPTLAFPARLA